MVLVRDLGEGVRGDLARSGRILRLGRRFDLGCTLKMRRSGLRNVGAVELVTLDRFLRI